MNWLFVSWCNTQTIVQLMQFTLWDSNRWCGVLLLIQGVVCCRARVTVKYWAGTVYFTRELLISVESELLIHFFSVYYLFIYSKKMCLAVPILNTVGLFPDLFFFFGRFGNLWVHFPNSPGLDLWFSNSKGGLQLRGRVGGSIIIRLIFCCIQKWFGKWNPKLNGYNWCFSVEEFLKVT